MVKRTATIGTDGEGVTLINIYEVEPERQDDLARLLGEATESFMRHVPGFISVSVHRSLDGRRVANYSQWASKEAFDRMLKGPDAQARLKQFAALAKSVAPVLYTVTSVHA